MDLQRPTLAQVCDAVVSASVVIIDTEKADTAVLFIRYIPYQSGHVLFLWMTLQHGVIKQFKTAHESSILDNAPEEAAVIGQSIINIIKTETPERQKEIFDESGVYPMDPAEFWQLAMDGRDPKEAAYFTGLPKLSRSDRILLPAMALQKMREM